MLVLHVLLAFFPAVYSTNGYDLEVNGKMRMSPEFLDKMKSGLGNKQSPAVQLVVDVPDHLAKILGLDESSLNFRTHEKESKNEFSEFIHNLADRGEKQLNRTVYTLQHYADVNASLLYIQAASSYVTLMRKYIDNLLKTKTDNEVDKEIILLDIIHTSNDNVYNLSMKMLDDCKKNGQRLTEKTVESISETMFKEVLMNKKDDFKYTCDHLFLCRPFPGFSDYIADLTNDIIKMSDNKFHSLLMNAAKAIKSKHSFFVDILGKSLEEKIASKLEDLIAKDLSEIRACISVMRNCIADRRKWVVTSDNALNKKTKAIRILLDIVDKAFEIDGAGIVAMHFEATIKALRDWVGGYRNDVETVAYTLFSYFVETLNHYLNDSTKEEVKLLVQIILKSKVKKTVMYKKLFSKGSNFTNMQITKESRYK